MRMRMMMKARLTFRTWLVFSPAAAAAAASQRTAELEEEEEEEGAEGSMFSFFPPVSFSYCKQLRSVQLCNGGHINYKIENK